MNIVSGMGCLYTNKEQVNYRTAFFFVCVLAVC